MRETECAAFVACDLAGKERRWAVEGGGEALGVMILGADPVVFVASGPAGSPPRAGVPVPIRPVSAGFRRGRGR